MQIISFQLFGFQYSYLIDNYVVSSKSKSCLPLVEGNPKAPFSIATTPRCRGGRYSFPGLLYFTLDPYLIMLSVKQGGIKYHFLSLWYDSTLDWTQVSRAIGEHCRGGLEYAECISSRCIRTAPHSRQEVSLAWH